MSGILPFTMQNYGQGVPLHNINSCYQLHSYQGLLGFATNLQEIVLKQQALIDSLVLKQQQIEEKLQNISENQENKALKIKLESNEDINGKNDSLPGITETPENFENFEKKPNIRRRNEFKPLQTRKTKKEKENHWDSDTESFNGSEKYNADRKNPSKAKHLWVNYGRRIIEYGINQTEGVIQEKIKQLVGKLNSKKDFKDVFELTEEDSEEDRQFKISVGNMAIDFVKNKAAVSFEGAKYKQQMINQRHAVAAWIERLISEE